MKITIQHRAIAYHADLSKPIDISIPLGSAKCFYAPDVTMEPFTDGDFVGSVKKGAPVNFYNVQLNPHGNGTHTESLGHITEAQESVNECLQQYHFVAQLISVDVDVIANGDRVLSEEALMTADIQQDIAALIIRTLPNDDSKRTADHSNTNPPYLTDKAMQYIVDQGVQHLLLDLPSVDRERDEGKLENHRIFWKVKGVHRDDQSRLHATITEMIYVPTEVVDGLYLLNIQLSPLNLDAAPSRPVLFELIKSA